MTTSRETENLHHVELRRLVDAANALPLADRMTLLKGLIPGVVRELRPEEFAAFAGELRLKGERFYDAEGNPGRGKADRSVTGERPLEGR